MNKSNLKKGSTTKGFERSAESSQVLRQLQKISFNERRQGMEGSRPLSESCSYKFGKIHRQAGPSLYKNWKKNTRKFECEIHFNKVKRCLQRKRWNEVDQKQGKQLKSKQKELMELHNLRKAILTAKIKQELIDHLRLECSNKIEDYFEQVETKIRNYPSCCR